MEKIRLMVMLRSVGGKCFSNRLFSRSMRMTLSVTFLCVLLCLLTSCASKILQVDNAEKNLKIEDYDKSLAVKEVAAPPIPTEVPQLIQTPSSTSEATRAKAKIKEKQIVVIKKPKKKLPDYEDSEGFDGRRPIQDPFRVGERVRLNLSYFNIVAGYMDTEVLPFKQVNGRLSYHFRVTGKSNGFFSSIYSVDDTAETFMDYEKMIPYNMAVDVKETKQLRTVRSYFDWKKMKAMFWEKKITKKSGVEERSLEWAIEPYTQNLFSAAFYLRAFTLTPGKVIQFKVADNNKNMIVKGHVLRRETIETKVGPLKTVVVRPEVHVEGIFKPVGEVFFWLTDDDRKFVVRIESKIKIGTIIGSVAEIVK